MQLSVEILLPKEHLVLEMIYLQLKFQAFSSEAGVHLLPNPNTS